MATFGGDTQRFQADILGIGHDADGNDDMAVAVGAGLAIGGGDGGFHAFRAGRHVRHLGAGHNGHALLGQRLLREGRNLLVFHRQDAVEHFDHGHLRAHVAVETGEFHADGT
jgi:hypothetical protein